VQKLVRTPSQLTNDDWWYMPYPREVRKEGKGDLLLKCVCVRDRERERERQRERCVGAYVIKTQRTETFQLRSGYTKQIRECLPCCH
jgi:hypothetical protein